MLYPRRITYLISILLYWIQRHKKIVTLQNDSIRVVQPSHGLIVDFAPPGMIKCKPRGGFNRVGDIQELIKRGKAAFEQYDYLEAVNNYKAIITQTENSAFSPALSREAVVAQLKVGWSFWYLGEWEMAEDNFDEAREKSDNLGFSAELGKSLISLGWMHLYRGSLKDAEEKAQSAQQAVSVAGDKNLVLRHRLLTGSVSSMIGHLEKAEKLFRLNITDLEGRESETSPAGRRILSTSYCQLALTEFRKGNLERAPFFTQRAIDILCGLPPSIEEGEAHRYLGVICSAQGDQIKALRHHTKALTMFRTCGSLYHQGKIFNSLGQTYLQLEELDHALFFFQKSLAMYEKLTIIHEAGALYGKIGHVHMSKEDFIEAEQYYIKDLLVSIGIEAPHNRAYLSRNVGRIFFLRKDYQKAIIYYQKAISLFKSVEDNLGMAMCLLELSKAKLNFGETGQAGQFAEQAMEIFTAKNYDYGKSETHLLLGIFNRIGKNWNEALHHFSEAEKLIEQNSTHSRKAKILMEIGTTNKAMGNQETAVQFFLKALEESSRSKLLRLTSRILERLSELDVVSIVAHSAGVK